MNKNGLLIYTKAWVPEGAAKAVVFLCHGFGEHCGRYEHVAAALTNAGVIVHAMDHQVCT